MIKKKETKRSSATSCPKHILQRDAKAKFQTNCSKLIILSNPVSYSQPSMMCHMWDNTWISFIPENADIQDYLSAGDGYGNRECALY